MPLTKTSLEARSTSGLGSTRLALDESTFSIVEGSQCHGKGKPESSKGPKHDVDEGIADDPFENRSDDLEHAAKEVVGANGSCAAPTSTSPAHQGCRKRRGGDQEAQEGPLKFR